MFLKDESSYSLVFRQKSWPSVTPLIYDCPFVKDFLIEGLEFITEVINADLDLPLPLGLFIFASLPRGMDVNVENVLKYASTKNLSN